MKYSVCIDSVFEGKDFCDSLAAIRKLGFGAFEFWSWWDKDLDAVRKTKDALGLQVAACCTRFVSLVDSARRKEYLAGLEESIAVAKSLGCPNLISQVGDELPGVPREAQHQSLVDGLRACAPLLETAGITLVFEPLNTYVDHPGYYLTRSDEAFQIADDVGSERVKVIFDIYHQQIMEGNLIPNITANIDQIGHFHSAGHPGRHELDRGEINYPEVFRAIAETSYTGLIGVEYFPVRDPVEWLPTILKW